MMSTCGDWITMGSDVGPQLALAVEPCFCRSLVACIDCGEVHKFVSRCKVCANAGRLGVPWGELPRRNAS